MNTIWTFQQKNPEKVNKVHLHSKLSWRRIARVCLVLADGAEGVRGDVRHVGRKVGFESVRITHNPRAINRNQPEFTPVYVWICRFSCCSNSRTAWQLASLSFENSPFSRQLFLSLSLCVSSLFVFRSIYNNCVYRFTLIILSARTALSWLIAKERAALVWCGSKHDAKQKTYIHAVQSEEWIIDRVEQTLNFESMC